MQGKGDPLDPDTVFSFELFNTPGTEVAPGSDVVGEDLQHQGLFHGFYLQLIFGVLRWDNPVVFVLNAHYCPDAPSFSRLSMIRGRASAAWARMERSQEGVNSDSFQLISSSRAPPDLAIAGRAAAG